MNFSFPETDESRTVLRSQIRNCWDDRFLFTVPYAEAMELGFTEQDALTLSQVGLPSFCAPHIHLDAPFRRNGNRIILGTNQHQQFIEFDILSAEIYSKVDAGDALLVAPSVAILIRCLLSFARMIDDAIDGYGENVFLEKSLPNELVGRAIREIETLLQVNPGMPSFWRHEAMHFCEKKPF